MSIRYSCLQFEVAFFAGCLISRNPWRCYCLASVDRTPPVIGDVFHSLMLLMLLLG